MEFRGITNLHLNTAYQLIQYLKEKESELGMKILDSIGPLSKKNPEPEPPKSLTTKLDLSASLTLFNKKVRKILLSPDISISSDFLKALVVRINQACWHYLEILENSINDLFVQIKLVGLERFKIDIKDAIHLIKLNLMQHMEDFSWVLKRLKEEIRDLRNYVYRQPIYILFRNFFSSCSLDSGLMVNLEKSQKYLSFYYQEFYQESINYEKLKEKTGHHLNDFKETFILDYFDKHSREHFIHVYECLKMIEINKKEKLIKNQDLNEYLRNYIDARRMSHIFEEYQNLLRHDFFEKGRQLKWNEDKILEDVIFKEQFMKKLISCEREVHLLGSTLVKYRNFILETDKNPYVRTKLGFSDSVLGVEPAVTENLESINLEVEEIDRDYKRLIQALKESKNRLDDLEKTKKRIEPILHEMSQPLISEDTLKHHAKKVLYELQHLDELGSLHRQVVDYVGEVLLSLLKHDWKNHVLFTIPEFEKIITIHIGILNDEHEDRLHLNRMNEFMRLGKLIKDLMRSSYQYKETEEILLHFNDLKGTLQDFLAFVQNCVKDPEKFRLNFSKIKFQLLEYRYFFASYFHTMEVLELDKKLIRNQFLFIDQYLDVVDNLLETRK